MKKPSLIFLTLLLLLLGCGTKLSPTIPSSNVFQATKPSQTTKLTENDLIATARVEVTVTLIAQPRPTQRPLPTETLQPTPCPWSDQWGEIDPETFIPCGVIQEEQSFQNYIVRIYKKDLDSWCSATAFEILKGEERVYAHIGLCRLQIGRFWAKDAGEDQEYEIPMGQDITGDGLPNLAIFEWAGGAYCCAMHYIYEIGQEFRYIDTISSGEYPLEIADLDQDGSLEFTLLDWSFRNYRGWNRVSGGTCSPPVILHYSNGSYEVAQELMLQPAPTTEELQAQAQAFRDSTPWTHVEELTFWRATLGLIYSGHAELVEQFLAMVFPDNTAKQTECIEALREALPRSRYWPQIREMNTIWPWPWLEK